ncbi:Chromosomal replication initiator protein DnaA [Nitratireductor basaltis]|uniref:Chromosomal replication initiator protein DnaA n=2 Tax=Nitratireductor basaltis TaxID=472175 RepID=A0A084UBL8_9HYPH|nr:Chromosomal replication initiator protein DnaA [Nitratireductor basaltis]
MYNPSYVRKVWRKREAEENRKRLEQERALAERRKLAETARKFEMERRVAEEAAQISRILKARVEEEGGSLKDLSKNQIRSRRAFIRRELAEGNMFEPVKNIIQRVAEEHGLCIGDLVGRSRCRKLVAVRQKAIREVHQTRPDLSYVQIGRAFNRDHTTVLHAIRKGEK